MPEAGAPELSHRLLAWFYRCRRDLPWREEHDPYRIWVSEVMLQQTRAETVGAYYQRWLQVFADPAALAAASEQQVLKAWEGLGYYSRARNLRAAAALLLERHGGRFPQSMHEARRLPGVGEYIAAAVLSIAYALPHGVVDGNVLRVVARLTADPSPTADPAFRRRVRRFVEGSFGSLHPGWVNQAWMELGALVCTPARPRCGNCPLAFACAALARDQVGRLPTRSPAADLPLREDSALLLVPKGSRLAQPEAALLAPGAPLLLVRRASRGLLGGLWELPTYTLRGDALRARLADQGIQVGASLETEVTHVYSHFRQRLRAYLAVFGSERPLEPWVEQRWVTAQELPSYPRPRVQIRLLKALGLAGS